MLTIAKMLRTGSGHLNDRDDAAINELKSHLKLYLTTDVMMLDYLRLLGKRFKQSNLDRVKRDKLLTSFMKLPAELVKAAGVSKKDYDQIKMLMKLDREIFMQESKLHAKNYL
jgi:hypothetical protein